jgi:hypothetical protein
MMVYNIQSYWVFRLCPVLGILKTLDNTTFRKIDLFPSSSEGEGHSFFMGFYRALISSVQVYSTDGTRGRHKLASQILQLILRTGYHGPDLLASFVA